MMVFNMIINPTEKRVGFKILDGGKKSFWFDDLEVGKYNSVICKDQEFIETMIKGFEAIHGESKSLFYPTAPEFAEFLQVSCDCTIYNLHVIEVVEDEKIEYLEP